MKDEQVLLNINYPFEGGNNSSSYPVYLYNFCDLIKKYVFTQ